jgi:hypothetical protein
LDDNGTPADLSDDTWTVAYAGAIGLTSVAVDGVDRVWLGSRDGLFLRTDESWQQVVQGQAMCSLVPAASGVLFAIPCQNDQSVLMIDREGNQTTTSIYYLARDHLDLLRSTTRPNPAWSIASDGGVWNVWRGWQVAELRRYDEAGYRQYAVPPGNVGNMIAGPDDRIWLTVDHTLWRMSPQPGFSLTSIPDRWLMSPGSDAAIRTHVAAIEGFNQLITLSTTELPSQITATFDPNPIQAGSDVTMTIQADASVALGSYSGTVLTTSASISHTTAITIAVVAEVHEVWLPVLLMHD